MAKLLLLCHEYVVAVLQSGDCQNPTTEALMTCTPHLEPGVRAHIYISAARWFLSMSRTSVNICSRIFYDFLHKVMERLGREKSSRESLFVGDSLQQGATLIMRLGETRNRGGSAGMSSARQIQMLSAVTELQSKHSIY